MIYNCTDLYIFIVYAIKEIEKNYGRYMVRNDRPTDPSCPSVLLKALTF